LVGEVVTVFFRDSTEVQTTTLHWQTGSSNEKSKSKSEGNTSIRTNLEGKAEEPAEEPEDGW
jgi:hypothetical protein